MFNDICFYVKGNMIEVNGQDFLLGELSTSCMNIPPAEFEEIYDKYKSVEYIMNHEFYKYKDYIFSHQQGDELMLPLNVKTISVSHDGCGGYIITAQK